MRNRLGPPRGYVADNGLKELGEEREPLGFEEAPGGTLYRRAAGAWPRRPLDDLLGTIFGYYVRGYYERVVSGERGRSERRLVFVARRQILKGRLS